MWKWLTGALAALTGFVCLETAAFATTQAGEIIRNQASATYFVAGEDRAYEVVSSWATLRVRPAPGFQLDNDNALEAAPGERISFPHLLTNTGNISDRYGLALEPLSDASALEAASIIHDLNENGLADLDEPVLTTTPSLAPGESIALVVAGGMPATAAPGVQHGHTVIAVSQARDTLVRQRTDTVTAVTTTPLRLSKTALPVCSVPIYSGSRIDYTLEMINLEELRTYARTYVIDGTAQRGFFIEDPIPANTRLIADDEIRPSPARARVVVRAIGAEETELTSYSTYHDGDDIYSVGLFLPVETLVQNQSGRFSFAVEVVNAVTQGTTITNRVSLDFDDDGQVDISSNETCNSLDPENTSAEIRFLEPSAEARAAIGASTGALIRSGTAVGGGGAAGPVHSEDASFVDAYVYRLDDTFEYLAARDGVYLEVFSTSLNRSAAVQEDTYGGKFIRVRVQSLDTGDILNVRLLETARNSGRFRSEIAFRLSRNDEGNGSDCSPALATQCVLRSVSGDTLQATILDPGAAVMLRDVAIVEPRGLVFDSASLRPVSGAEVFLRDASGAPAIDPDTGAAYEAQVTAADGLYTIPRLGDGDYYIDVRAPSGYSFASTVAPDVFAGRFAVESASYGRDGFDGMTGSGLFSAHANTLEPEIDVPLDPDLSLGQLQLTKKADTEIVRFGDQLRYTLVLTNTAPMALLDLTITDAPAPGLRYVEASARLDDVPVRVERGPEPRIMNFAVPRLDAGQSVTLTYDLQVGPDARPGRLSNVAIANGRTGGGLTATSGRATERVQLRDDGLLSDRAYLIGSVFVDANENGLRDEGEVGLPRARIWLEDGTWVETDELGQYSLYGLRPGTRIARLDEASLPDGFEPRALASSRTINDHARFVDLMAGELHRAEFPLTCPEGMECGAGSEFAMLAAERAARLSGDAMLDRALAYQGLIGTTGQRDYRDLNVQPGPDGDISSGVLGLAGAPGLVEAGDDATWAGEDGPVGPQAGAASNPGNMDAETLAKGLEGVDVSDGVWIWPLPDARTGATYSRDGRVIVAVSPGTRPILYINDQPVTEDSLGALIENARAGAQLAAWYGVELPVGTSRLSVRGTDDFGNERVLAAAEVIRPGDATKLVIEPPVEVLDADGLSQAQLTLRLIDKRGAPAVGTSFVTLEAEIPGTDRIVQFAGDDVQPTTPGFQVRTRAGAAVVELVAPDTPGEVRVTAVDASGLEAETEVTFASPMRDMIAVGLVELTGSVYDLETALEPADDDRFPNSMETDGRVAVFLKGMVRGNVLLTLAYDSEASRSEGLFRDIDPEAYYPIYGDAGLRGFDAQSRSKLYVRVENENGSVMWGDFRTDATGDQRLFRTQRTLTGVNAERRGENWMLQGFAAEASERERVERIRGQGTALSIVLPGAPIVTNSETLIVETRAKDNPGLIIEERTLVLFRDYLLDDDSGRLILKEPLPAFDSEGNPVFLLARYETEGEEADALVAGVRSETLVDENTLAFAGATLDETTTEIDRNLTVSVGLERTFDAGRAYAEAGLSDTELEAGGDTSGLAYRLGIEAKTRIGDVRAEYAEAETDFRNIGSPVLAGRREARAALSTQLDKTIAMKLDAAYSSNLDTDQTRAGIGALFSTQYKDWALSFGPRYTIDDAGDRDEGYGSVVGRIERPYDIFGRPATHRLEFERALPDNRTRVEFGSDVLIRDDTRLYANHRILDQLPDQTAAEGLTANQSFEGRNATTIGVETSVLPQTDVYGEWREGGALDSGHGEAAYGIRSAWEIVKGLSIQPQLEIVQTFDRANEANAPQNQPAGRDFEALSLAIADRRFEDSRRSARMEVRSSDQSNFYAGRFGWAQRFTPEWTGAVKLDAARDNIFGGPDSERVQLTTGLAVRPLKHGRTDMLALYQWRTELAANSRRSVNIASLHANQQPDEDWTLSGRLAARWDDRFGSASSAQLAGWRAVYRVDEVWDMEVRAALASTGWGEAYDSSLGVGMALKPAESVRVALGYNFVGFHDRDLDPSGYHGKGLYWGLAIAFGEDWFGWLEPQN